MYVSYIIWWLYDIIGATIEVMIVGIPQITFTTSCLNDSVAVLQNGKEKICIYVHT